jgi:hypothetical protein
VVAVRSKVMGTDESRASIRSQIWGMSLMFNPPVLWITLNPADVHDPVAQVLAGADIDLDRFDRLAGPNTNLRAKNIAEDPYAAAKFFRVTILAVLETLFGIRVPERHNGRIKREDGILGQVAGYIGAVEAQGRGTLHLHLLVWLRGAPSPAEMKALLQTQEFRQHVANYIHSTIRADLDGADTQAILAMPKEKSISYCRPPDPAVPGYQTIAADMEGRLARAVQVHACSSDRCQVVRNGKKVCKRRAPFDLSPVDWIGEDGTWGPKRTFAFFNNWNPTILVCLRANHDIKLITNGPHTKDLTWYITSYACKKQGISSNISALLARRLAFHSQQERYNSDCQQINRRLLQRCANTLSRDQELSGPEVINYLMGWSDRFISHHSVTIYWDRVVAALKRTFPELRKQK